VRSVRKEQGVTLTKPRVEAPAPPPPAGISDRTTLSLSNPAALPLFDTIRRSCFTGATSSMYGLSVDGGISK